MSTRFNQWETDSDDNRDSRDRGYDRYRGRAAGRGYEQDRWQASGREDDQRYGSRGGDYDRRVGGGYSRDYGGYGTGYGGSRAGYPGGYDDYGTSDYGDRYDRTMTRERNYDRGYGQEYDRDDNRAYGRVYGRGYGRDFYGRTGRDEYGSRSSWTDDREQRGGGQRGWIDRASDEVASWFGDEEAERRRQMDAQRDRGGHAGRGPKGYRRSDERIREDVNDRLTDHAYLDATNIEVSVKDGIVTLSGSAESRAAKRLAEDLAESVTGVKDVDNNIRVNRDWNAGAGAGAIESRTAGTGTAGQTTR